MDKCNTALDQQRKRLAKVFKYLKERKGVLQADISKTVDIDEAALCHLKDGKIKYIKDEFLEKLHKAYNVNPHYIRLESDIMFDIPGVKLSKFETFVDCWDVVERGDEKYLHFTMDSNFYDFLLEVDKARLATDEGISSLEGEIESLKEIYSGAPDLKEFVLVPRNNFIEILRDIKTDRKQLDEILDLVACSGYDEE